MENIGEVVVADGHEIDGRTSAWVFRATVALAIVECTRSATAAYELLKTNPKTGQLLLTGKRVRRDIARNAANEFLDFLFAVRDGAAIDPSRFHTRIVQKTVSQFATDDVSWQDLVDYRPQNATAEAPQAPAE